MIDILNFIIENLISYYFISKIEPAAKSNKRCDTILGLIILALSLPLFIFSHSIIQPIRILIWFVVYTLSIHISKHQELTFSLYQSAVLTTIHTAYGCIWMAPLFRAIHEGISEASGSFAAELFRLCIVPELIYFLLILVSSLFIKFEYLQRIPVSNYIAVALALLSQSYLRATLHDIYLVSDPNGYLTLSIYSFCFTMFVLGFIFLLESNRLKDFKILMQTQTEAANYYRLENYRINEEYNQRMQSVYHDFKNHLLALEQMSQNEMSSELNQYIHELITDLNPNEKKFNTGNDLLNGLISTKYNIANSMGISFVSNVYVEKDFPLSDVDIFTVFGNLLDNAIEAADKVKPDAAKDIRMSSYKKDNFYIINITNTYDGVLKKRNGHFYTTKKDEELHGIGLKNIHNVLKKYNGNVSFNTSSKNEFSVSVFIPFTEINNNEL